MKVDLNLMGQGCMPFYEAKDPREHRERKRLLGPKLHVANKICFEWCDSKRSAASAPILYRAERTCWKWPYGVHTVAGVMGGLGTTKKSLHKENKRKLYII